jgi:uncharacterized protein YfiM (DUF2279 family)
LIFKRKYQLIFILSVFTCANTSYSSDSSFRSQKHKNAAWIGLGTGVVGTHLLLYKTWYSQGEMGRFHWIDDSKDWLQMDKTGHVFGAYFTGTAASAVFRHTGYSQKKSAFMGAAISLAFQMPIEYFDGRSPKWGASKADIAANLTGTTFAFIQNYCWGKPRIPFRVTFHKTDFASLRPELLGSNLPERLLKDYNGQTYWLDLNPERIKIRPDGWPKWLGFNVGYGAGGLLGGTDNVWTDAEGNTRDLSSVQRYRQYYLGPSISLGYLKQHPKRAVRILAHITDKIRIPMPAMEFNSKGKNTWHWIYW